MDLALIILQRKQNPYQLLILSTYTDEFFSYPGGDSSSRFGPGMLFHRY